MQYTDAEIASLLMQDLCQRVSYEASPALDEREMVVSWKVSHNKYQEAVHFLERYGIGEHAATGQSLVLLSPIVDNETYPGVWRVVRNFFDARERPGFVFQVRRRGWLESIVNGAGADLLWDEARLISGRDHTVFKQVAGQTDDFAVFRWRNLNPAKMPDVAKAAVDLADGGTKTFKIFGDDAGAYTDWRMTPPEYRLESDGSGSITIAFVRLGVTESSFSGINDEVSQQHITETVTEEQVAARVAALKVRTDAYVPGAGVPPHVIIPSIQVSRSRESGIATIRYTVLTSHTGSYSYTVHTGEHKEYHIVKWEQLASQLPDLENWVPTDILIANVRRRVSGVRRNPDTLRYSYHIVVWDAGEEISNNPNNPTTSYRVRFQTRSMWSILNNMYWDQTKIICYAHQSCRFTSFAAANAWIGGDQAYAPTYTDNGVPVWGLPPPLVDDGAPMPRQIGVNEWLGQRRVVAWQTEFFPYEPS
jgi:hypothetical protein